MRIWNSGVGQLLFGSLAAWVCVACGGDDTTGAGAADATADGTATLDSGGHNDATVADSATGTDSSTPKDAASEDTGPVPDAGTDARASDAGTDANASDTGTDADARDAGTDAHDASTCDDAGHCFDVLSQGTVGATVGDIVLDTTNLFWTERGTGKIMSAPIGGGAASLIASGQATPIGIGVDDTFVYWANSTGTTSGIAKAPKSGAGPTTNLFTATPAYRLVVDVPRSKIWFVDDLNPGNMLSMGLNGSNAGEFEGGESFFKAIVVDSSGVYGAASGSILGGTGAGGSESFLNNNGVQTPFAMASDTTNLYFVDTGLGQISSLPKTGGTPTSIGAAGTTTDQPLAMAVAGGFVYWADVATGKVKAVDTAGANAPRTLVSSPATPRGIAVDATWVYWSSDDGAIRRITR